MEDTIVTTEVAAPVVEAAPTQDIILETPAIADVPNNDPLPIEADVEYQVKVINDLIAYTEELETSNQSFAKAVEEKEAALATLNEQLSSKDSSLEQLNVKLQEMVALETMVENMEEAWSKVAQHEILGAINQAIAN
jgi:predicted RNase H-like nuclease (RuvC/YqgF family)